jgi:hypothetical protein
VKDQSMTRLAALLFVSVTAFAQSAMQGVVVDPTAAAIPDAAIRVTLDSTGATRTARTGPDGRYHIPGLAIGTYHLRCEKEGFQRADIPRITVALNQTVEQTIQLKLAAADSTIDVHEQPDALDTTAPTVGVGISRESLEEVPSQQRSYLGVVLLAPGVTPAAGSNTLRTKAGVRSALPDSGFTFAGLRARNNSLSIDGLDNRDETTGSSLVAVGQEAVAEFRVSASGVAPEFGGGAGGILNVVTLSGTNRFHGDVNLFAGDAFLDARNPEVDAGRRAARREYQPEAALNGPLRRDRTFFATTVEVQRESGEEYSEIAVPGATAHINAALASSKFDRAAVRSISAGLFPSESTSTQTSFKLTHRLDALNEVIARYAISRARIANEVLGVDNFSERSARGTSRNQDQSLAAGWQTVRGPAFVNELRFQFARRSVDLSPNSRGALLEIPGVASLGQSAVLDSSRAENHLQLVDSTTVVRGSHMFGFGASIQRVSLDARLANRFGGVFIFPTLDDFVRGTPEVFLQGFGDPQTRYSTLPAAFWAQDQWRVASGITVMAGFRYEIQKLPAPFSAPRRNIAPRIGVAWQPGGKGAWVFRAGAGLFYDRYPLAFLNDAIQKDGLHAFEQYATGASAVSAFAIARGGSLPAAIPGIAPSVYSPDMGFNETPTYARKLTAGVERALDTNTTLAFEYMNVAGFHLPRIRNAALTLPPRYALEQSATSRYQGFTVTLRRRLAKELAYMIAYTAGNAEDDASDYDEHPLDPANTRRDWARSRQYQAHRVVASALFELPVDLPWNLTERLNFAPIVSAGSPRPVNALATTDLYRTGAYPISARPDGLARNPFYQRGTFNVDLRITKGFEWWPEHGLFLFGIGIYNLTNHTNPLRVSPYHGSPTYRGLIETLNARQTQFSFQWEF